RRLHEPRDLQPHVPGDRRRDAVELSRREWTDGGPQLLPDVGDAAGGGGGGGATIEQFWRRRRSDGLLASGSSTSTLAKEKTSDDHQAQRRLHHGPEQGRGS